MEGRGRGVSTQDGLIFWSVTEDWVHSAEGSQIPAGESWNEGRVGKLGSALPGGTDWGKGSTVTALTGWCWERSALAGDEMCFRGVTSRML